SGSGFSISYFSGGLVQNNESDHNYDGIDVYQSSTTVGSADLSTSPTAAALGNLVHDNAGTGIYAHGGNLIAGNSVWNSGGTGIYLAGSTARRNVVHHSGGEGISTDATYGGSVYDNRVYVSVGVGVHLWNGSPASGNTIYDNTLGILAE